MENQLSLEFSRTTIPIPELKIVFQPRIRAKERIKITSSKDAVRAFRDLWDTDMMNFREEVKLLCLNRKGDILGFFPLAVGGLKEATLDIRITFTIALNTIGTVAIMVAHNHPSGDSRPSRNDEIIAKKMVEGGKMLDIRVNDFIILTCNGHLSFAEEGLL
jgi:DNA repair protein RadC